MRRNLKRKYFGAACVVIEEVNNTRCKYLRDRFLRRGWEYASICRTIFEILLQIDFFSFQSLKLFTIDNSKHKNRIYPNKDPYHVRELKKKKIKIKNKSQKIAI